jgi:WD40 repeat protein
VAGDSSDKPTSDIRSKVDSTGEFFSVGAALHAVRAGYVRRRADDLLYEALIAGRFAHVVAPDRSGKSSLVAATAARLESNACKVAILDLAQLSDRDGGTDSGRWYYSVAYRLLRQLRIRFDLQEWWQDKSFLSSRQRLLEFYSEVLLQNVPERIVIFVDEVQCIENLSYADELLTSIRAAHNARTTDPDFSRLSFVLLGECDPVSLLQETELSPFNITQQILLEDFTRAELDLFLTELNCSHDDAVTALDRIFYWTMGQPYLTQKLARAVARESSHENVEALVDRLAIHQLAGRAALHSEPHMSHIHRAIIADKKSYEGLLNLYGKISKGIDVAADLGSPLHRRLMAIGLLVIDEDSNLKVRNRLYEAVFTTRWANENLPIHIKIPAIVVGVFFLLALIPFWYTQWLPGPYVRTMLADNVDIEVATEAYDNFRSFPGHSETAEKIYRRFLEQRAAVATEQAEIKQISALAAGLPNAGRIAEEFEAGFWDRKASAAARNEDRDAALMATLQSLTLATTIRRQRAATLVSDDYPLLLQSLPKVEASTAVFDPLGMVLSTAIGARISQFSHTPQGIQQREPWTVTALEVIPLVRRVIVDRTGTVDRIGLTLNISHSRLADLRIKVIAPSGRAIEIDVGIDRASSDDDIRIPFEQLQGFRGEMLSGTWSISVRDERLGIAGQLVGWNLNLNSQAAIENFQRGLNIPDPIERETDNIWFDSSGRYAVARTTQSDSARIWDLAFAEPLRAIALPESEILLGLDASARHLVTATQDTVNLWDTTTGDRVDSLAIGAASSNAILTQDGNSLFVERRSDLETRLELWSLDSGMLTSEVVVAGVPALVSIDAAGERVAVADFDRAVRVWEFKSGELLGQFDLPAQPSTVQLSADGQALATVYQDVGISVWSIANSQQALLADLGGGNWQISFSPSGSIFAAGRAESGYQVYNSRDGRLIGPRVGLREQVDGPDLLSFSQDEQILLTGRADVGARIWRVPKIAGDSQATAANSHTIWSVAADRTMATSPDGNYIAIGDPDGHVHTLPVGSTPEEIAEISADVSFVGHNSEVRLLSIDSSGEMLASVGADNSIRLWRTPSGEPLPIVFAVDGAPISHLEFSPDAGLLGLLNGTRVSIIDSSDGSLVAEYNSGIPYSGLTFAANDKLYLGDRGGNLHLLSENVDGKWQAQTVWQGENSIRLLRASPRGDFLIIVDDKNLASQFILSEGRIAESALQLPSAVREVAFDRHGVRAYFGTARWVHKATSSSSGLVWVDAVLMPPPLKGAALVHGNGTDSTSSRQAVFLPVANNAYLQLREVEFHGSSGVSLFGSRNDLLQEWRARLNAAPLEGS